MVEPWKNALVDPQQYVPYLILVCLARSSAELIGESIFAAVKKARNKKTFALITYKIVR